MKFARITNCVYVVRVVATGAFKVGVSSQFELRLRALRRTLGPVEPVTTFAAPRFWTDALRLERRAHRALKAWALGGELFSADCAHVIAAWMSAGRIASSRPAYPTRLTR
jgi:hypothetical protein